MTDRTHPDTGTQKRERGLLSRSRSRAQSDLIGVTLLIGVVVVVVALVGVLILAGGSGDDTDDPLADLNVSVTATTVTVTHEGGDALQTEDIRVVLQSRSGETQTLQASGSGSFEVGDSLTLTHDLAGDGVTVRVVDGATSTVLTERWLDVPSTSGGLRAAFTYQPPSPDTTDSVAFDASPSSNPGSELSGYEWDFGDGGTATGETATHSYADDGTYDVTLTVEGPEGGTETATETITVQNVAPTVSASVSESNPPPGETVTFTADATDPDGSVTGYEWEFGDGSTATGETVTHSYSDDGTYTVTLSVTDDDGATNTTTATVTVSNEAPTASFTVSPDSPTTQNVQFDASAASDPDGSVVSYEWELGDGSTTTGETVDPSYGDDGTYTVTLTVTDDDGATATSSRDVTLSNAAPTAAFGASSQDVDGDGVVEIVYDASNATDSDGSITTYEWDYDDDGVAEETTSDPVVTVELDSPLCPCEDDVTLRVTDDDGATDVRTKTDQPTPDSDLSTPGFEVFGVLAAVLLGGWLRRRDYL